MVLQFQFWGTIVLGPSCAHLAVHDHSRRGRGGGCKSAPKRRATPLSILGTRRTPRVIGGGLSTQCASAYCMVRGHEWHMKCIWEGNTLRWGLGKGVEGNREPPHRAIRGICARPFRYRDNILGVPRVNTNLKGIKKFFVKCSP